MVLMLLERELHPHSREVSVDVFSSALSSSPVHESLSSGTIPCVISK